MKEGKIIREISEKSKMANSTELESYL